MEKLSAKIENWSIVDNLIFNGFRELKPGQRLTGYLTGHKDLPNGVIYTSVIKRVDPANGVVETPNTVYHLGQINEEYRLWVAERNGASSDRKDEVRGFVGDPRRSVPAYSSPRTAHACR
jgi:hypothetical protein